MRMQFLCFLLGATLWADAEPPGLDFAAVGNPGNPPDAATERGAVAYAFEMGACEITNEQYARFLNAVAAEGDPFELYSPNMENGLFGGIGRTEEDGRYRYAALPDYERLPVVYVSWYDAARFCNWLHFGCPETGRSEAGTTEGDAAQGAYDTSGAGTVRNAGARYALPTVDEWIKAGYYDPARKERSGYWAYPVRSDERPECAPPPGNAHAVNYFDFKWAAPEPFLTPAGAYTQARSAYGTYDQGGNVMEWLETLRGKGRRWIIGGDATKFDYALRIDYGDGELADQELYIVGFRVVRLAGEAGR